PERNPWKSPNTSLAHRYTPPSPGYRCANSITATPCGQKNKRSDTSHSQMVTPPFAAMDGSTFRLNTATTNSSMRSRRPSTRFRWGWFSTVAVSAAVRLATSLLTPLPRFLLPSTPEAWQKLAQSVRAGTPKPENDQRSRRDGILSPLTTENL